MNTIQNKGYLWEKCVEKGLFANIPKGSASKIQTMFESSVERFSEKKEPLDVLNLQFLTEFKDELDKLNSFAEGGNITFQSTSIFLTQNKFFF